MVPVFEPGNAREPSAFDSEDISRDIRDTLSENAKQYFDDVEQGIMPFVPQSISAHISTMRNESGETLLIAAARCGHVEIVEQLLAEIDVEETDHDGWTALLNAAQQGHGQAVEKLLEAGAIVDAADLAGWTPLMWACYKNRLDVAEELIRAKANVNVVGDDDDGLTPLIVSAGRGYTDIVRRLLLAGATVNTGDKFGSTPIIWAARKGFSHIVSALLGAGAEVDVIGMQASTALMLACRGNHAKVVNLLLAREPNVNIVDYNGLSALAVAAREGYTEVVQALIHAGAFVNLVDRFGNSILASAVRSGNIHIVRLLLEKHADVNAKDSEGRTPLHLAIDKSFTDIVVALLEKKPNLELKNKDGDTALMRTVKNRDASLCQLMVNMGAKISATDNQGDNSLHLALRARSRRLTQILLVNPSDSKLLYRPNRLGETPYSIDQESLRPLLPAIFGPIGTDVDVKSLLGFDIYSDVLADVVCEPNLSLPLTVGLYAKWGSGKSLLLPKIRESMRAFSRTWIEGVELYWSWSLIFTLLILCGFATLSAAALLVALSNPSSGPIVGEAGKIKALAAPARFGLPAAGEAPASTVGWSLLYPAGVGFTAFLALAAIYAFIYYGSEVRLWNGSIIMARLIARAIARLRILVGVLTINAPMRSNKELVVSPVSFLFSDDHRLSFIGGEQALVNIVQSLFTAAEQHFGTLAVRLLCTFHHARANQISSNKLQTLCGVPVLLYILTTMVTFGLSLIFFICYKAQVTWIDAGDSSESSAGSYAAASSILMGVSIVAGLPLAYFLFIRLLLNLPKRRINRISHKIHRMPFQRMVQKLQKEVDLLVSVVNTLDAFTNSQTRLVITVDGLDSVEHNKMVQILDALTLFFSSRQNAPFIVIYAVDPQIIISAIQHNFRGGGALVSGLATDGATTTMAADGGGNAATAVITGSDYMKNVISMPFFLDHVALKNLQTAYNKRPHVSTVGAAFSRIERRKSDAFKSSRLSLREHKEWGGSGGGAELVPGSIAMAAHNDLNLFPSHDYFSNMNPRSMRRIVNSIALSGRLLRTFEVDFSWIALYNWISLVEQWPYRVCWLLEAAACEVGLDAGVALPELYEKIKSSIVVAPDTSLWDSDRNVAEFDEIITKMRSNKQQTDPLLTVGQIRAFAPCTSNLNPQLRKIVAQQRAAVAGPVSDSNRNGTDGGDEVGRELPTGPARYLFRDAATWATQIARPLPQMSIEEVAELIRRLQIPDERIVELVKRLHRNNINGLVLQSCDLGGELRQTLAAPLGDWTLIQLLIETLRRWSPPLTMSPAAGTEHASAGAASAILTPAPERSQQQQHNPRHQASSLHSIKEGFEPENTKGPVLIVEDGDENCAAFTNDERVALLDRGELQSKEMEEEIDEEEDDVTSTKSVAGSSRSALKNSLSPGRDLSL